MKNKTYRIQLCILWLLLGFLAFFFLYACMGIGVYNKMSHLSSDELEWVDCYEPSDTCLFVSNFGNQDTVIIHHTNVNNFKNPFYFYTFDYSPGPDWNATASFSFTIENSNKKEKGCFLLHKQAYNNQLMYFCEIDDMVGGAFDRHYVDSYFPYSTDHEVLTYVIPIKSLALRMKNGMITESLIFNRDNTITRSRDSNSDPNKNFICGFAFGKGLGLLWYRYESGELFVRKELEDALL